MANPGDYQDHLEWEYLPTTQIITHLTFERGLYDLRKDCVIQFSRDNNYDLVATMLGILDNRDDIKIKEAQVAGTFISAEIITGFSPDGNYRFRLSGAVISNVTSTPISISSASFTAKLIFDTIEKSFVSASKTESIHEWYLSSNLDISFPRSTKRDLKKSYEWIRETGGVKSKPRVLHSYGSSNDHILISTPEITCIVAQVMKDYGPSWSSNLSIEYRTSFGRIPSDDEREAVSELVSFIFGCQLLKIGQTSYDKNYNITLQEFKHPWGDNVITKCQKGACPPVCIRDYNDRKKIETLFNSLLPQYFADRSKLRLKDVLWKFWFSRDSHIGTNLPILSSALETLSDQILKAHPDKKHYYIDPTQYVNMIKKEIAVIETILTGNDGIDRMLNKIKGASNRGSTEKLDMMFEILDLPVGKIERQALKARNKMAHASLGDSSMDELKEIIRLTHAYETLFHRVFLKLLSYKGNYIDYYSFGHPQRNINEPIPE